MKLSAPPLLLLSACLLFAPSARAGLERDILAGSESFSLPHAGYVPPANMIRYVDRSSTSSTQDGSAAHPWKTLQAAINNLLPGQAAYVAGGQYTENLTWSAARDGNAGQPIVLMAKPGDTPWVVNAGTTALMEVSRSYWIIHGFYLQGAGVSSSAVRFSGPGSHNNILRKNTVINVAAGAAVYIGDGAHHIQLDENLITETNKWSSMRMDTECDTHADCAAYEPNPAVGLVCINSHCATREDGHAVNIYPDTHHILLTGNTMRNNSGDGVQCVGPVHAEPAGTGTFRPHDILLKNNTIANTSDSEGNTENAVDIKDCDDVTISGGHFSYFRATRNTSGNASKGEAIVLHFDSQGVLIEDLDIADSCRGIGLGSYRTNEQLSNVVIRRNIVRDPPIKTALCPSNGLWMTKVTGVDVYHNTFDGMEGATLSAGEEMGGDAVVNVDVWNNIFKGDLGYYIGVYHGGVNGFESGYNLFANGASTMHRCNFTLVSLADWRTCSGAGITGPLDPVGMSKTGDPLFANLARETQQSSPARNAALNDTGATGYCGSGWDMGAKESCSEGPPPPPNTPPVAQWALQRGTTGDDTFNAVATNSVNDIFYAGFTTGEFNYPPQGGKDAIIGRYSATGSRGWSRLLGDTGSEEAYALAIDSADNVYAAGGTSSNLGATHAGSGDAFLAKYSKDGTKLWVRQPGTPQQDSFYGAASDGTFIYAGGATSGSLDGQPRDPAVQKRDYLLMKFDANGNTLWTRAWGTGEDEAVKGVAFSGGAVYVLGEVYNRYISVAKFGTDGTLAWEKTFTFSLARGNGIAADGAGNIYVTGYFQPSSEFYTPLVIKLDSAGTPAWTKSDFDWPPALPFGVACDSQGNVLLAGSNRHSLRVWKLSPAGAVIWAGGQNGGSNTYSLGIAVDKADDIVLVGDTLGDLFSTNQGWVDAWILKYPN